MMASLLESDLPKFKAHLKYERKLMAMTNERGWAAAEAYHWLLFQRIADGEFDLERDGPFDAECMRELDSKFKTSRCKGACTKAQPTHRASTTTRAKPDDWVAPKPGNCSFHGNVAHLTNTCKAAAKAPPGSKAQFYKQ
jgi:hypothetical protein